VGLETAALAAVAGGSLFGAVGQDRANARNTRAAQQQQQMMRDYINPYLTAPGQQNPYAALIQQFIGKGGGMGATAPTPVGTEGANAGQDALLQMMRASPDYQRDTTLDETLKRLQTGTGFDTSKEFEALNAQDMLGLNQQVAGLHASAGSLGQRFGTAMGSNEARLRSQFLTNQGARNAQIAQGSFEANRAAQLQAAGLAGGQNQFLNNFLLQAAGQRQAAATAAGQLGVQGRQIGSQEQQFNVGQQQAHQQFLNNFILQALMGAGGLQQGSQNQNTQLLALLGGQQVPQQQPSALPGAVGDLGQLALLWPFLQQTMGGAGGAAGAARGRTMTLPQGNYYFPQPYLS
jgi:hypothetical protein